jgi:hypothetical protein
LPGHENVCHPKTFTQLLVDNHPLIRLVNRRIRLDLNLALTELRAAGATG